MSNVIGPEDWERAIPDLEFRRHLMEARRRFQRGEQMTAEELRRIYRRAAQAIADEIALLRGRGVDTTELERLELVIQERAQQLGDEVLEAVRSGIRLAIGTWFEALEQVTVPLLGRWFVRSDITAMLRGLNEQAVVAVIARRGPDGLRISDRVWRISRHYRQAVQKLVEDGVARGIDPRKLARQVQQYLRPGVFTAHKEETRRRLGVPRDVSMEAMRLAVSEMQHAFHEATIMTKRVVPGYKGIYWRLSSSHPVADICDRYAAHNGDGFWPAGDEPSKPHPWCRCYVVPVFEDTDNLVYRMNRWVENPSSEPDIEKWYNENARMFLRRPAKKPEPLRVSDAVARRYPELVSALGRVLRVDDEDHPEVQQHLEHLRKVPTKLLTRLREAGLAEIHFANATVPGLDNLHYLKGVQPRGWPPGMTWDIVPGAYSPKEKAVVAGVGRHGSVSVALHELGHAVGDLLGYNDHPDLIQAHKEVFEKLKPYHQQDGPGGVAGRQEMLAEGFATYLILGRKMAVRMFGELFVNFLEKEVLK
ncbi:MAG TPA: hypothetical protein VIK69_02960 [Methylophilaceae bacterium]